MKEVRIKDICDKGSSNLKQKDVEGSKGKYPVYGASGIISSVDFYHQDNDYIAIVKDGSGIGRVSFMPAKSSVIGTMQYILPHKEYDIKYISYCLQSLDLSAYKQGAAIPHIYFRDYGERIVKVTEDRVEQQQIVDFLDAEFAKIDELKKQAEQSLQNAKDLFQAALKEMLTPKEGWVQKKLADLCSIQSGYAFKSQGFKQEGKYQVIRMGNVRPGIIRYDESAVFVDCDDDQVVRKALLEIGDIIITQTGTRHKRDYGFTAIIDAPNLMLNQRLARIRVGEKLSNKYLLYHTWTDFFRDQFFANEGGTVGQGNVGMDAIKENVISLPPLEHQIFVVETLDSLHKKVLQLQTNYTRTIQLCADLKQALLRQVFE